MNETAYYAGFMTVCAVACRWWPRVLPDANVVPLHLATMAGYQGA